MVICLLDCFYITMSSKNLIIAKRPKTPIFFSAKSSLLQLAFELVQCAFQSMESVERRVPLLYRQTLPVLYWEYLGWSTPDTDSLSFDISEFSLDRQRYWRCGSSCGVCLTWGPHSEDTTGEKIKWMRNAYWVSSS